MDVQHPQLQAVIAPLSQRRWTAESQRHILRHNLMDLALYRALVTSAEDASAVPRAARIRSQRRIDAARHAITSTRPPS